MPLFEMYPWLLIPVVISIVEAWSALKKLVRLRLAERQARIEWDAVPSHTCHEPFDNSL